MAGSAKRPKNRNKWLALRLGSTGLCPLSNGYFYISHNAKTADDLQHPTLFKYKCTGDAQNAFTLAGETSLTPAQR